MAALVCKPRLVFAHHCRATDHGTYARSHLGGQEARSRSGVERHILLERVVHADAHACALAAQRRSANRTTCVGAADPELMPDQQGQTEAIQGHTLRDARHV